MATAKASVQPERGRLYRWPRNRAFGDSKQRPVLVIAPDAATSQSRRWVVVPLSSDPRLTNHPLAVPLPADASTGLDQPSHAMAWLPTTVDRDQLAGPMGRTSPKILKAVLTALTSALDLTMLEPWQGD